MRASYFWIASASVIIDISSRAEFFVSAGGFVSFFVLPRMMMTKMVMRSRPVPTFEALSRGWCTIRRCVCVSWSQDTHSLFCSAAPHCAELQRVHGGEPCRAPWSCGGPVYPKLDCKVVNLDLDLDEEESSLVFFCTYLPHCCKIFVTVYYIY